MARAAGAAARKAAATATSSRRLLWQSIASARQAPPLGKRAGHLPESESGQRSGRQQPPGDDAKMPGKKESRDGGEIPHQAEASKDAGETATQDASESEEKREAPPQSDEKETLLKKNEDLLMRLKYLQAEFENYQKRALRERQDIIANAQEGLLTSLLPVLDDFDKAMETLGGNDAGFELLRTKLIKVLKESGLREIPAKGEKFDPFLHDAAEFVNDGSMEDGTIREVVRKGYRCNLKVIRPSLVIVVKNEGEKNA